MRHKLLPYLMLLLAAVALAPQEGAASVTERSRFTHIGVKEGLSNGFVNDMTLDNQGFMWVATNSGLNRISGKTIDIFSRNNSELPTDEIVCLYFHRPQNQLWMGTRLSGISVYDCNTGRFSVMTTDNGLIGMDIADIIGASDGGLWILHRNNGVQHYSFATSSFDQTITREQFPPLGRHTRSIAADGDGKLYVGHFGNGLTVVDLNKQRVDSFRVEQPNTEGLVSNFVRSVFIDSNRNIWVGTNKGVVLFNPLTRKFRPVPIASGGIPSDNIHDIFEARDGKIYISSDMGELTVLEPDDDIPGNGDEYTTRSITALNSGLSSPNVRKVCEDAYGNIWVGHFSTGVDFIQARSPAFATDDFSRVLHRPGKIYGMGTAPDGSLWVGGENFVARYDGGVLGNLRNLSPHLPGGQQSVATVVYPDSRGNIWLGINDVGVLLYNVATDSFRHIDLGQPLDVGAFWEDADGTVWIATEIGPENSLYSYKDGKLDTREDYNSQMPRPTLTAIMRDNRGRLWVGSLAKGIFIFGPDGKRIKRLQTSDGLPSGNINQIFKDSEGTVWIATFDGLVRVDNDESLDAFTTFDYSNGLPENHIRSITEDLGGNIWVSTYSGVSCMKKGRDRFDNFDRRDGLPESGFSAASAALLPDGSVCWGSIGGLSIFNPLAAADTRRPPRLQLVGFESVNSYDNVHLSSGDKGVITVPYDDNSIRIHFTVDNYAEASQIEYAYMLEGLDKEWQYIGGDNSVYFKNLSPGKYRFRLRARLKNGDWNDANILDKQIIVQSPPWLSWWAILLYCVLMVIIVYYGFRYYRRRLLLRSKYELQRRSLEMERKQRQDEQDLNNERMRFFTNVAHELRTPLTLIIGPLEDLVNDRTLPARYVPQIKSIHGSSVRLLNLINQIMEFRKTETQNRELAVAKGSLNDLITEIGLRYKELYRNDNVEFRMEVENLNAPIYFDREIITTIVNNFLSNAIKYTDHGYITLRLDVTMEEGEQFARISVEDTGYGIEAEMLPHIYDRYFQAKGKHQASGTGIGLALVKSLAELHKGQLRVESKLGVGSTFSFLIRVNEIYPDAKTREAASSEPESLDDTAATAQTDSRPVVLVVEDNAEIRNYIGQSLQSDYTVLSASNGNEGLDLALRNTPDIVVSDIMMPGMDGIELCKALKADIRTSHVPVILLTAKDSNRDKEAGYASGADSYLTKPFSTKLLKARVANLLEGRRKLSDLVARRAGPGSAEPGENKEPVNAPEVPQLSKIDSQFLAKLDDLIDSNLTTAKIDMAFLTDRMNMSHSTFYRKIKVLTGLSPVDYVRKIKLRKSLELLKEGTYNISEIAYMTGFNSPAHYREAFKDEYGISPSRYLKEGGAVSRP